METIEFLVYKYITSTCRDRITYYSISKPCEETNERCALKQKLTVHLLTQFFNVLRYMILE